ncbi:hypothetical protein ACFCV3_40760 [Kribbella sp. NPDC056345]|uniref:hypothetical protein n=1 Tax=Kribbella sp. NPDC056345 TaxID=3345789 RepID=UPI0035E0E94B
MTNEIITDPDATYDAVKDSVYTFLPWLRTGIATKIKADPPPGPGVPIQPRAKIPIELEIVGEGLNGERITKPVTENVEIYGPGDVVGVDPRAIVRTEPRPWITNVEPNYLAHIEFYDEDFCWRYSPASSDAESGRLAPWLALVVLAGGKDPQSVDDHGPATGEFKEGVRPDRPLPFIDVVDPKLLPNPAELGAWAHVHVNGALDTAVRADDPGNGLAALQRVLAANADNASSRLICPRHLQPNTSYHAFLVPAFEAGRLAGLGGNPAEARTTYAWGADIVYPEGTRLPYYHRWYFSTGNTGDFEALVRLLKPVRLGPDVGRRDLDVQDPKHPLVPGITTPTGLNGVLKLGGALKSPAQPDDDVYERWDEWPGEPVPHPFQVALAKFVNLADDYVPPPGTPTGLAAGEDPVITPPLYGRWPALTSRLSTERPADRPWNWIHKLNLDPRYRVAANFGTQVIQEQQEELMAKAWEQVGDVVAANERIRAAQLAVRVGLALQEKHLEPKPVTPGLRAAPLRTGRTLALTAPANSRVTTGSPALDASGERLAVGFRVAESVVATAPLSAEMRRIMRPGARLVRSLKFSDEAPPTALVPLMDKAEPDSPVAAEPKATPAAVVTPKKLEDALPAWPSLAGGGFDGELPFSQFFEISEPGAGKVFDRGDELTDSTQAERFKLAIGQFKANRDVARVAGEVKAREPLGADATGTALLAELSPERTIPKALGKVVDRPDRFRTEAGELVEAMAYPTFDTPMYEALLQQGDEHFVPGINKVPPNSVTLLKVNQPFIESYLVGLNHELARELLWREFPTDQRGTPFRQFWDVKSQLPLPGETAAQRRERLYDIEPLHHWTPDSELGMHDNRDRNTKQEDEVVLVIRGELLRKYPNAVVYAHKAAWYRDPKTNQEMPQQERDLVDFVDPARPGPQEVQMPIYEALVAPDVYLLGFDLTEEDVKGAKYLGDAGWFFVIKERPGDPRFGIDDDPVDGPVEVEVWNDLTWNSVDPGRTGFVPAGEQTPTIPLDPLEVDPTGVGPDQEKLDQRAEDQQLGSWGPKLSSAEIAYMLFQAPVLMAVHAQEMLPKDD